MGKRVTQESKKRFAILSVLAILLTGVTGYMMYNNYVAQQNSSAGGNTGGCVTVKYTCSRTGVTSSKSQCSSTLASLNNKLEKLITEKAQAEANKPTNFDSCDDTSKSSISAQIAAVSIIKASLEQQIKDLNQKAKEEDNYKGIAKQIKVLKQKLVFQENKLADLTKKLKECENYNSTAAAEYKVRIAGIEKSIAETSRAILKEKNRLTAIATTYLTKSCAGPANGKPLPTPQ